MSTLDLNTGRSRQKARTRDALVAAARDLTADGIAPSVEQAAERAQISRTTAYRYFPNQRLLLEAAHPETTTSSLLGEHAEETDVRVRLDQVVHAFTQLIRDTETQQRVTLRLSLENAREPRGDLPLRQGRAIAWIEEALGPLHGQLSEEEVNRLAVAVRSAIGIEALVWLTDVAGLSRDEAQSLMRWGARAMVEFAQFQPPPTAAAKRAPR